MVAVGVALAWFLVGRRDVPREAPQDVSFVTRAGREELYGNTINDTLVVNPSRHLTTALLATDKYAVDGVLTGGPVAVGVVRRGRPTRPERLRALLRPVHPRRRPARRRWPSWR